MIVSGTVLGNERETGTGLLDVVVVVVVGTVVRAVRAVGAVGADTAQSTATGHWPKGWDSKTYSLSHTSITFGRTYNAT
jgi:hypothetical protein